jgi:DNA (cytosine-5)-methyltransferase 1
MKFISVFAGIGGFDLGLERAGHECIGQIEIDKHATSILKKHWKDVPKHDDIRTAKKWAEEKDLKGKVDIVCGGFPCQDLSTAGNRAGIAGARSGLFYDAIQFAKAVEAKYVILENVPGLLSSNKGRDFGTVLNTLDEAGYTHIEWRILDSQFFGVAQRRKRVFIIASTIDRSRQPILIEQESSSRNNEQIYEAWEENATSVGESIEENKVNIFGKVRRAQSTTDYESWDEVKVANTLTATHSNSATVAQQVIIQPIILRPRCGKVGTPGGKGPLYSDKSFTLATANDQVLFDNEPMPTLTVSVLKKHDYTNPALDLIQKVTKIVRRLTPIECERLQGFPDNWTSDQSDSQRYKQLGNAVTVNVIEWIGKRL